MKRERKEKKRMAYTAKECAYIAVFVALVISAQLALSMLAGVEVVTVLFIAYAFTFGVVKGMFSATVFSLVRQLLFGVDLKVLVLYLIYYNFLTAVFGILGKNIKEPKEKMPLLILIACVCTVCFTMLDNLLTPLWYGYTKKTAWLYFKYSLPVVFPQTVCTGITTALLFLPLRKVFLTVK